MAAIGNVLSIGEAESESESESGKKTIQHSDETKPTPQAPAE
jgi:hypothetical protein